MAELNTVDISSAKDMVTKMVAASLKSLDDGNPIHMPIFLHSSPGVGKSAIISQVCEELGIGFIDVRLGQMESSDVQGIPFVAEGTDGIRDEMKFSIPDWFPRDPDWRGIVFFDELSNAPISVQHAAYRLINDRGIHSDIKMPKGAVLVAAGNLKTDKTGAKDVAPALANRFGTHLHVKTSVEAFTSYAVSRGLHEHIVGFLNFKPDMLYQYEPGKNTLSFPTPRSWEKVSTLISMGFSDDELSLILGGAVGQVAANEFMGFRRFYGKLPDFTAIMKGKEKTWKMKAGDRGLTFAATSSIISLLAENYENDEYVANLQKVFTQLEDDFLVMLYKSLRNLGPEVVLSVASKTKDDFQRVRSRMKQYDV